MRYRSFGKLGWKVSEIGFGAWALGGEAWGGQDDQDSLKALNKALELGCNFIDTARAYGNGRSERIIGDAIRQWRGNKIYVASKIPPQPGGDWPPSPYDQQDDRYPRKYVREQVEASLRELGVEQLDLMQIHTWSRAWNAEPAAFEELRRCQAEGKIAAVGVSTPEHDQNAVADLMRGGWVDSVQLIYNIFDQEPQAELLPLAASRGVAVIVRVPFDESSLTGKLTPATRWDKSDFRSGYFAGDRLERTIARVDRIRKESDAADTDLAAAALKFCLKPAAVSTVIPGIRNERQAVLNCGVSDQSPLTDDVEQRLRKHYWRRSFWYAGK